MTLLVNDPLSKFICLVNLLRISYTIFPINIVVVADNPQHKLYVLNRLLVCSNGSEWLAPHIFIKREQSFGVHSLLTGHYIGNWRINKLLLPQNQHSGAKNFLYQRPLSCWHHFSIRQTHIVTLKLLSIHS